MSEPPITPQRHACLYDSLPTPPDSSVRGAAAFGEVAGDSIPIQEPPKYATIKDREPVPHECLRRSARRPKPVQCFSAAFEPSTKRLDRQASFAARKNGQPSKSTDRKRSLTKVNKAKKKAPEILRPQKKRRRIVILKVASNRLEEPLNDNITLSSSGRSSPLSVLSEACFDGHDLTQSDSLSHQSIIYHDETAEHLELLAASRRIMVKTPLESKPLPRGEPRVWADSRQALCETILYYQAWQGACYINKGVLYAFMFDSNGHERDLIDGDVIIARARGAMSRDKITRKMLQCRDQVEDSQTQAMKAAIALQNPVVIFCGNQNADVPASMPHRYNSLGWFKPTHVWAEKSTGSRNTDFITIKYRFEKLNLLDDIWWTPEGEDERPRVGSLAPPISRTCEACDRETPQIYLEGHICLNTDCDRFWMLRDRPIPAQINYDPRFLKQRTSWNNEWEPYDIRPSLPYPGTRVGDDTTYAQTRGMCCPKCGKCTSRYLWKGWRCSNEACNFEHDPQHHTVPSAYLRDAWHPLSMRPSQSNDWADPSVIQMSSYVTHNYRFLRYTVPGVQGFLSHLVANEKVLREERGPDEMFEALQTLDCGMERRRFSIGKEEYMTAFSSNFGMPYKFVASGDSRSFEDAPWPIRETRSRLNWAAKLIVGEADFSSDLGFNELLSIGYFGGQNIKYHDDGESGLGETVASLSLGYAADMSFRVKSKHWNGMSASGILNQKRPLPNTPRYPERLQAYEKLQSTVASSSTNGNQALKQIATDLGLEDNTRARKPWIRMRLSHGDIVIMHGRDIQEYLEHQVDPMGVLRFGLTARTILPGHLKPEEMPSYHVIPDDGYYDGSGIADVECSGRLG